MKRFLSALLCAVLLLGLLPAVSPPAKMITSAVCSVNRTSAYIGDKIIFTCSDVLPADHGTLWCGWTVKNGGVTEYDDLPMTFYFYMSFPYYPKAAGTYTGSVLVNEYGVNTITVNSEPISVKLRPATKITKVEAMGSASLKLTWNKISGAAGYEVWRSTSKTTGYKLVKTTTALSFTNTFLKAGTRYFYKIRSYNMIAERVQHQVDTETWSKCPSSAFSVPAAAVPLAKSAIISAVGVSRTQVKLTWKKVAGATGYQILRSATPGGVYKSIKLTTALTYTAGGMLHAKTYYFKVRPYKQFGTVRYYGPLSGYKAGRTK